MTFDPTQFSISSVVDTCSVWNMLSSRKLYQAVKSSKRHFCITPMVLYECSKRPSSSNEDNEMINRFEQARENENFPIQGCDLDDLASLVRIAPRGLGSGELSCIAVAYKIRSIGLMTDDKKARLFANRKLNLTVETTPKLYGWLHYHQHLTDGDHTDVINEHQLYESRPLSTYFKKAYEEAARYRLMQHHRPF
jgi:hypothetical protein